MGALLALPGEAFGGPAVDPGVTVRVAEDEGEAGEPADRFFGCRARRPRPRRADLRSTSGRARRATPAGSRRRAAAALPPFLRPEPLPAAPRASRRGCRAASACRKPSSSSALSATLGMPAFASSSSSLRVTSPSRPWPPWSRASSSSSMRGWLPITLSTLRSSCGSSSRSESSRSSSLRVSASLSGPTATSRNAFSKPGSGKRQVISRRPRWAFCTRAPRKAAASGSRKALPSVPRFCSKSSSTSRIRSCASALAARPKRCSSSNSGSTRTFAS